MNMRAGAPIRSSSRPLLIAFVFLMSHLVLCRPSDRDPSFSFSRRDVLAADVHCCVSRMTISCARAAPAEAIGERAASVSPVYRDVVLGLLWRLWWVLT